jgi:outer membrane lipoprotein-sorting protein
MVLWHSGLLVLTCVAANAFAEDGTEHLNRAADAYRRMRSLQVEAVAERNTEDGGRTRTVVVRLYTAEQGKVRIETLSSNDSVQSALISNGKTVTEYRGWINQYTRLPVRGMSVKFSPDRAMGWGEMSYETIADGVSTATVKGQQTLTVRGDRIRCVVVSVEYIGQSSKYSFWIAERTGLVLRRAVTFRTDQGTGTLVSTVRAMTINENIADSAFEFTPPAGATEVPFTPEETPLAAGQEDTTEIPADRQASSGLGAPFYTLRGGM